MLKKSFKRVGLAVGLTLSLALAACGGAEEPADEPEVDVEETEEAEDVDTDSETAGDGAVGESLNYTITGIDAGAGVMAGAERAIEDYNLEGYELQASSDAAMTAALAEAIDNEEPIVVTGWNPHWKFTKFDLKYLDDPEGSFGDSEDIHTFTRMGLEDDMPEAFAVLENFFWTEDDMGE